MANGLQGALSPYLLSHAHNPVDWYPWGEEAFEKARRENKPIFLSIGYSACHWCHVMERENFEDKGIAALLNGHFVAIKVDREERPDVDDIYMDAVQAITGRGGWPMSVWLDTDLKPFYGGTYYPRDTFFDLLTRIAQVWQEQPHVVRQQAKDILSHIEENHGTAALPGEEVFEKALEQLKQQFDPVWGGFGSAPKFPPSMTLAFLLSRPEAQARTMAIRTLDAMWEGGMYDHLAGGFARYSVDEMWHVPHFEKMLYDNAQLASVYVTAYERTGNALYARVAGETLHYLMEEMRDPAGGFYCAEDADSEGEEGKFYLWTPQEVGEHLDEQAKVVFCEALGVTPHGTEGGRSVLRRPRGWASSNNAESAQLAESIQRMKAARAKRVRPHKDDKILCAWNALAITAFAQAARALGDPTYLAVAQGAARFIHDQLFDGQDVWRVWRQGAKQVKGQLEDYGALMTALTILHEVDGDNRWLQWAEQLALIMLMRFEDKEKGGFFSTEAGQKDLIRRKKPLWDHAMPSGNAFAVMGLVKLAAKRPDLALLPAIQRALENAAPLLQRAPLGVMGLLNALAEAQRHLCLGGYCPAQKPSR